MAEGTKQRGAQIVRRFRAETGLWPWQWRAIHVDEWLEDLATPPKRARRRKGALTAFRDAALFKTIYAWGLRRQEAARLDVSDFSGNPHRASFGAYGALSVRYGKSSRGSAPKRRSVLSVFDWSVEVIEQYIQEVRPLYGLEDHPALWPTERGARLASEQVSERFAEYRDELGLPGELTPHALRHSYVTHLIEDGWDELFVRMQVGHSSPRRPRSTPASAATTRTRR